MQLSVIEPAKAVSPKWSEIAVQAERAFRYYWQIQAELTKVKMTRPTLLSPPGSNTKLSKGDVPIYGLTLAPAGASGYQMCSWRSPECEAACLGITAGRSRFHKVQQARINKTRFLMEHPYDFFLQLYRDLHVAATRYGKMWAYRSNVLSDVPWESVAPWMYYFTWYNYDYTKSFARAMKSLDQDQKNWLRFDLTLSHSGHNWSDCETYMRAGGKAAVVFNVRRKDPMLTEFRGWRVIDGDATDFRYNDPVSCIVGLRAKGGIDKNSPFVLTP